MGTTTQTVTQTGMAPPPIDFDWKHLAQRVVSELGLPPEIAWMLAGIVAFFIARRMVSQDLETVRSAVEAVKSIVQIEVTIVKSSLSNIAWARLLVRLTAKPEAMRASANLLAAGAGLARLDLYSKEIASSIFGVVLPIAAIVIWLGVRAIAGKTVLIDILCIGVAWTPVALLGLFWLYYGDLLRQRNLAENDLRDLQGHY